MERRYLAAALALIATFAIFSKEFRSGHLAKFPSSRAELQADIACAKHYVAEQVMAKLQPYVDRGAPEQAQMLAELNLPQVVRAEEKIATVQALVSEESAHQKCEMTLRAEREAERAQRVTERAMEINMRNAERAQRMQELVTLRVQELSQRAAERAAKINVAAMVRAQEVAARSAARSMERAQCGLKSGQQVIHSGVPIHISLQTPAVPNMTINVPAAPVIPATPTSF